MPSAKSTWHIVYLRINLKRPERKKKEKKAKTETKTETKVKK